MNNRVEKFNLNLEWVASGLVLIMLWWIWQAYPELPDQIATHFKGNGQPDQWDDKATIWILPAFAAVYNWSLYFLMRWFNADPLRVTSNSNPKVKPEAAPEFCLLTNTFLFWHKFLFTTLFFAIALEMIEVGMGRQSGTSWRFWAAMAAMLGHTFYYCYVLIAFMYRNLDTGTRR